MCIVYCITNLTNGKRYVGWSNRTLEQRWKKHVSNALVRKRHFLLSEAIRKYGPSDEVWKRETLARVETPDEAKRLEVKLIAEFNTCALTGGFGYNMTLGGDGGTLSGAANPFYGHHHTPESVEKIRRTIGDRLSGENNPQWGRKGELSPGWGRKHTQETIERIASKNRGQKRTDEQRAKMREANTRNKSKRSEAQKRRRERERLERESLHESTTH